MRGFAILPSTGAGGGVVPPPIWTAFGDLSLAIGGSFNVSPYCVNRRGFPLYFTCAGLPAGVQLSTAGLLTVAAGTALGTTSGLQVLADDHLYGTAYSQAFALTVGAQAPIWLGVPNFGSQIQGSTFSIASYVIGFPVVFSIAPSSNSLAGTGLSMNAAGLFTVAANAQVSTTVNIVVRATTIGFADSNPFSVTVHAAATGSITWIGPASIDFTVGVPASIDLAGHFTGPPAVVSLGKDPAVDGYLSGVSFDANTRQLSYDGSGGLGDGFDFVEYATDGHQPVVEEVLPYNAIKPYVGTDTGIQWDDGDRASKMGRWPSNLPIYTNHVVYNNQGFLLFENTPADWYDSTLTKQGSLPWVTLSVPTMSAPGRVSVNVTSLVQAWQNGLIPNLGIFGMAAGILWVSTARQVPPLLPGNDAARLHLTFTDGSTLSNLAATTETHLVPDTAYPNTDTEMRLDANSQGIWYWDPANWGTKAIQGATIDFMMDTSSAGTLQIFALRWSQQDSQTPFETGIAWNYTNDVGLSSAPGIDYVEDFEGLVGLNDTQLDTAFRQRGAWVPHLDESNYVTGDTDTHVFNWAGGWTHDGSYRPVAPGVKAFVMNIGPSLGDDTGRANLWFRNFAWYHPSNGGDIQEQWVRWYEYEDGLNGQFNPARTNVNKGTGHLTGIHGDYTSGFSGTSQTGYPNSSDFQNSGTNTFASFWAMAGESYSPYETNAGGIIANPMCLAGYSTQSLYVYSNNKPDKFGQVKTGHAYLFANGKGARKFRRWYCLEQHVKMNTGWSTTATADTVNGAVLTNVADASGIQVGMMVFGPGGCVLNDSPTTVLSLNPVTLSLPLQENGSAPELFTVPGSPYQITVTPTGGGRWTGTYRVSYQSGGQLTKVTGTPSAGEYQELGSGVYQFAGADSGLGVFIQYFYTGSTLTFSFGKADGIYEHWVDGRLALRLTDMCYGMDPKAGIVGWNAELFINAGVSTWISKYISQVAFSRTGYIGPMRRV